MKISKIIYLIILILLIVVFCVSAWQIVSYMKESQEQKDTFNDLAALVDSVKQNNSSGSSETVPPATDEFGETVPPILPEYEELFNLNPDLVGWIRIEDTQINYPVMQTPSEKDYYLHRNFYGENSSQGCIYVRESCDVYTPSDNVTIYGHHMRDGSMFAGLKHYTEKEYWEEHGIINFDTLTEHHTYQIFAVFKTSANAGKGFAYHRFENASDEGDFDEFIAQCKSLSFYDTGITPAYGDKIICLSTCEYTLNNGRLVVAAVRIS